MSRRRDKTSASCPPGGARAACRRGWPRSRSPPSRARSSRPRCREDRPSPHRADSVADVLQRRLDERDAARIAAVLRHLRHAAESSRARRAASAGVSPDATCLSICALEVEAQLVGELPLDGPRRSERAQPDERSVNTTGALAVIEQQVDRGGQRPPRIGLFFELPPALSSARSLGAPVVVRHVPVGLDPAAPLQAVQRRVERALVDLQRVVRDLAESARRSPSRAAARARSP